VSTGLQVLLPVLQFVIRGSQFVVRNSPLLTSNFGHRTFVVIPKVIWCFAGEADLRAEPAACVAWRMCGRRRTCSGVLAQRAETKNPEGPQTV
jgi:hypothetical protein